MQNKEENLHLLENDIENFSFTDTNHTNSNIINEKSEKISESDNSKKTTSILNLLNDPNSKDQFEAYKNIFITNKNSFLNSLGLEKLNNEEKNEKKNLDYDFNYLLHVCVHKNNFSIVEYLIKETKNILENFNTDKNIKINKNEIFYQFINRVDNLGYIPLHYAVLTGNIQLINILLENNSDVKIKTKNGFNCLHLAASLNKIETFIFIYENKKNLLTLEDYDFQENRLLHISCFHGAKEIVDYLIANKIEINPIDKKGNTPLHLAVFNGKYFFFIL